MSTICVVFWLNISFLLNMCGKSASQSPPPFKDYSYSNVTQMYYRCYGTPINFTKAVDKCIEEGAELAVPRNKLEFQTLKANFGSNIYSVWLALTDRETEGQFKTLNGIPESRIYTNWEPNEPNDAGGNEDCVEMLYDGRYNDGNCDAVHAYICTKPLVKSVDEEGPTIAFGEEKLSISPSVGRPSLSLSKEKPPISSDVGKPSLSLGAGRPSISPGTTSEAGDNIVTPKPQPERFREDYTYVAETGYYYKAHSFARNFSAAASICIAEGAELAVPYSENEANVLITKFRTGTEACWLGIHDILSESEFQTINGTPSYKIYMNWKPSFPNYFRDDRDCVIMDNKGFYYDTECKGNYQFICTRHESTISSSNVICNTYDNEYFYNIEGDRCYKLHTTPATWNTALSICRAEQASLAIINSAAEAKALSDALGKVKKNYKMFIHVDFNDLVIPNTYMTSNGMTLSAVGYEEWEDGEPDNKGSNEHCGGMLVNGRLADVNCATRALFFCEKVLDAPLTFELLQRWKEESKSLINEY